MLIYKIIFSLLILFSLLIYIFCGHALEKDENEDSQLYFYLLLLLLLLLLAINA